jgi:hypothetical protein
VARLHLTPAEMRALLAGVHSSLFECVLYTQPANRNKKKIKRGKDCRKDVPAVMSASLAGIMHPAIKNV